ncbi:hypothetical protein VKT23_018272 [Stygiomarasmius scandens]|uniref:CxC1-like cysteine cluster associated with KDZ transposases domain-containing protein n=1 Tax=Marasmiellus scandens TaxID=2682957 RepID=A0ABR1IPY7_9AGAR
MTSRHRVSKSKPPRVTAADYTPTLIDTSTNPLSRKGPRPLVHLSGGQYLVQNPNLPRLRGQVGLNGDHPAEFDTEDPIPAAPTTQHTDDNVEFIMQESLNEVLVSPSKSTHRKKKERQWKRWLKEVIPTLVNPYMEMLKETDDLREDASLHLTDCCSCNGGRYLEVSVVRFNSIEKLDVWFCSYCSPVAPQLVRSGLFPCAPFAPTLVVDIRMLDFVSRLFLRISPNVTAWCGTLEDYLRSQGYWLRGQDPLRRRFGNCLLWFTSLQDAVRTLLKSTIENTRLELLRKDENEHEHVSDTPDINQHPEPNEGERDHEPTVELSNLDRDSSETSRKRKRGGVKQSLPPPTSLSPSFRPPSPPLPASGPSSASSSREEHGPNPQSTSRASTYLRSRCPLCFGGTSRPDPATASEAGPRVIVMLDACFTHKHRDQHGRDPPRLHPDTLFIPEEEVKLWETKVAEARSTNPSKRAKKDGEAQDDHYEHGMRVPKSALDVCLSSFDAAHETLAKASCSGYDNTGDGALLCPHDAALFLRNYSNTSQKTGASAYCTTSGAKPSAVA